MCSSCGPRRMLVPWVEQFEGARTFNQAEPQRVCAPCSKALEPVQAELVATYSRANEDNVHTSKSRLHLPYTSSLAEECQHAADIIGNFFRSGDILVDNGAKHDREVPATLLQDAKGFAILTVVKAGFPPVSNKIGTGLVVRRLKDGSWSAPSAISMFGAGFGFEIGNELTETVLILGSDAAVEVFCDGHQVNVGAGIDATFGPLGRSISVAAAASIKGSVGGNYSYSQSRGFCFGVALEGAVISTRGKLNRRFYGQDVQPRDLLSGSVEAPNAARPLYEALEGVMQEVETERQSRPEAQSAEETVSLREYTGARGVAVEL